MASPWINSSSLIGNRRLRADFSKPAARQEQSLIPSSVITFSPSVKIVQQRRGSRAAHAHMELKGGFATTIEPGLAAFIAEVRSFYLATASKDGQPYVQHRGGPPGFLRVLDENTLAFADFSGNRQYITTGNLAENPRAMMFLMDYANRRRIKIWGTARVVEHDAALNARLFPEGYKARADAAILFTVEAWDANCPQHIPQMLFAENVALVVDDLKARITALEGENAHLRSATLHASKGQGS
jgi:predicted pyridoxine 5'-phosphate oxidase superfamily flavin-nucleotide-binding protein